ncbi:hypothetical protein ACFOG5_11355 [Pedobacter fastidiosus]|uniref:CAAX protease self-immunity n=1 Tax=Pedobacter fastidiosus TaxID=2765361 RepID=A0ABR7KX82_9SPHI|nr:hypothetical protein [Pedobacter fastidiosus]
MIEKLPVFISITFGLITLITLWLFYNLLKKSTVEKIANPVCITLIIWLVLQAVLTLKGFYNTNTTVLPPKIMLFGILPAIFVIILLFATPKGRRFIDALPLKDITYLNTIRLPIEIVLFYLFLNKAVPQLMTFEGRNFDIISGITAPFIAYFGFTKQMLSRKLISGWNFVCLILLINIVANALLSAPLAFQQFAFNQPNIAILNFPFSWLPTFLVPIVLFGHLVSIRQLLIAR